MIDIGANLCHDSFDADRSEVLQRASDAGISKIIVTGSCVQSVPRALELAQAHPGRLFATAGIHPHHAAEATREGLQVLAEAATHREIVATGEMGLDFFRDFSPHSTQEKAFHAQLELAVEMGKPVFLHQRDAHHRFLPILKEYLPHLPRAVVHCFTGNAKELHDYLDQDLYVGVTGWICDERRGRHLWDFIGDVPADRLMIETDAPYLLPRTLKPKPASRRNEPMHLVAVAQTLSGVLGKPLEQIAAETTDTANTFFGLR